MLARSIRQYRSSQELPIVLLSSMMLNASDNKNIINATLLKPIEPDVFMDVQMPVMDGITTTRALCRRWPLARRPRIVGMTGNVLLEVRQEFDAPPAR